jgi:hypothetical protein
MMTRQLGQEFDITNNRFCEGNEELLTTSAIGTNVQLARHIPVQFMPTALFDERGSLYFWFQCLSESRNSSLNW